MRSTTAIARTLAGLQVRLAWRPAAAAFATIVLTSALAYPSAFSDPAARARLAAVLHHDRGIASLFGDGGAVTTMAGFVEWRSTVLMGTIVAVWAVLTVARMIRGAEDDGHADLVGTAPLTRRTMTACALVAASVLAAVIAGAVGAGSIAGGLPTGRALLFGLTLLMPAPALGALVGLLA